MTPALGKNLRNLPKAGPIALGGVTQPPLGFVFYCARDPRACQPASSRSVDVTKDGRVVMGPEVASAIMAVNMKVNREIRPVAESPGAPDVWEANVAAGDCEDFALTKQRRLLKAGWPSSALLMAKVRMRDGSYHAILVTRTSTGDYVLDNMTDEIRPWNEAPYRFIGVQSPNDPAVWRKV
nr:transglutaminase-like cysteine peptidase [Chthonobacter rhizosphaerae]